VAPRAYWKGYLRLSLVSCPIALFPATSEREKISFHQINRDTGNRIRYRKVDAETGEEVASDQIIKGYEVAKGEYVEITDQELESVALESTRTIEIDEFVPRTEIDDLYNVRPYYIAPDGKVGQDAFVVIRSIIEQMKMVAIGRVVLTSREHVIAMEPRGKGLMGTLLRFPYEVRNENEFFDDIPNVKLTKDMMDLARHIVETKTGHFKPAAFEDHYEHALRELIDKKAKGEKIEVPKEQPTGKVINLMDALRRSVQAESQEGGRPAAAAKKGRKAAAGQKEMLLPIAGKKGAHQAEKAAPQAEKAAHHAETGKGRTGTRHRKAG
jgi:DNA end-binding protein Ku